MKPTKIFQASRGTFFRFKIRSGIHNIRIVGDSANANMEAASKFPEILKKIIEEEGYLYLQIFNVDETGLYWQKLPSMTYLSENEKSHPGYKASKGRITILFGGNSSGDLKLKPMLVYLAENPRSLKGVSKDSLSVFWLSNKKGWVTRSMFEHWLPKIIFDPLLNVIVKS